MLRSDIRARRDVQARTWRILEQDFLGKRRKSRCCPLVAAFEEAKQSLGIVYCGYESRETKTKVMITRLKVMTIWGIRPTGNEV